MSMMRLLLVVFATLYSSTAQPSADSTNRRCEFDLPEQWPNDKKDEDLNFASNVNPDESGPIYKLSSEVDIQRVQPETKYKLSLQSLQPGIKIYRFLISVDSEIGSSDLSKSSDESNACESPGELLSISDVTKHISYSCHLYLVDRSQNNVGLDELAFEWESPKCGCSNIRVEVMNGETDLYTFEDDPFKALTLKSCVGDEKEGKKEQEEQYLAISPLIDGLTDEIINEMTPKKKDEVSNVTEDEKVINLPNRPANRQRKMKKRLRKNLNRKAKKIANKKGISKKRAKKMLKARGVKKILKARGVQKNLEARGVKQMFKARGVKRGKKQCCLAGTKHGSEILQLINTKLSDNEAETCEVTEERLKQTLGRKWEKIPDKLDEEKCADIFTYCCQEKLDRGGDGSDNNRKAAKGSFRKFKKQQKAERKLKKKERKHKN